MEDMMNIYEVIFGLILLAAVLSGIYYLFSNRFDIFPTKESDDDIQMPDSTRQMPKISEDFEIPEKDQEYLLPITTEVLKKLAFCKRMIPTNAMLIEHLAESLSIAAQEFTASKDGEPPERKNEAWLMVAAFAIRLYDEGTPHNSRECRDAFVSDGTLAQRRLEQWANRLNNEIANKVKEGVLGKEEIKDVTNHINTVGGTPYTEDEIEDMKNAADQGQSGKDSAFQQAIRNPNKDKDND